MFNYLFFKKIASLVSIYSIVLFGYASEVGDFPSIIPYPQKIEQKEGISKNKDIIYKTAKMEKGDEAYILEVNPQNIIITSQSPTGKFYALQTLKQLKTNNKKGILCCKIIDAPRFAWRGLMIDEGRHFFGKDEIKRLLDVMAIYKMNRFHWHLTDSEGWRIEIKKYPKLATVGGIGNWTTFQKNPRNPKGKCQYYTQEDIREIVAYAKERFIEIIPEIDMPGHASAMNRAYPEYDGGGNNRLPKFTLNPGKEETYKYLTDILIEIKELFPSKWIHFGGDEVHFANKGWDTLPDVARLKKRENLKNSREVEYYFNRRMAEVIRKMGKVCVGWDEVVTAGLPPKGTLVNWWRHDKMGILKTAIDRKYDIVLCPRHPCYFDFIQDDAHKFGRRWDGFNNWERVYNFPEFNKLGIKQNQESQILGIQACVWSETIPTAQRMEYLTFPRLQVLAESAWTMPEQKNLQRFREKSMPSILKVCRDLNLKYYNPLNPKETPEIAPADVQSVEYIDPATPAKK